MDNFEYHGGGRFFAVTNRGQWKPDKQEEIHCDDNKNLVEEIVQCEQVNDAQSEALMFEHLPAEDTGAELNGYDNNQWPPPPEERPLQKKLSAARSDPLLYTSFLTIDVSSSSKNENLNTTPLHEDKHRASLLNLVTGSREESLVKEFHPIDRADMKKIKHDLEMISKYLEDMPLAASLWPQNYDVLRDLVKLYLAAKNSSNVFPKYLLDHFLKLDWPGIFLKCIRKIMDNYPQVFLHSSDRKVCI